MVMGMNVLVSEEVEVVEGVGELSSGGPTAGSPLGQVQALEPDELHTA